jgi:hypothetical protein
MIWSLTSLDPKMRGHSEKYWVESFMGQELHQASRLGPKDNTTSESSQVTYTSITSKKPST